MEKHDRLSHEIIGACIQVHRTLGPGFHERVYRQAVAMELAARGLPVESGKSIEITYNGVTVGNHRLDLLVGDVVVKLFAGDRIEPRHYAQARSHVRAAHKSLGLLLNFSESRIDVRRIEP